ncbi:uncharacterized protein METZ01_LOCUS388446, partial [marine metagenome]
VAGLFHGFGQRPLAFRTHTTFSTSLYHV